MTKAGTTFHVGVCLVVATIVVALACSNSSAFPFSGPGCTGAYYSDACWSCMDRNCNARCAASACADYFKCVCACPSSDSQCATDCVHDQSCVSCLHGIGDGHGFGQCWSCASQCYPMGGGDASTDASGDASTD